MSDYLDKLASLMPKARKIICDKATEAPFTGQYDTILTTGTYLCRRCGLALFRADSQFHSGCGWPSFDVDIPGTVKKLLDPDGVRMEIRCHRCDAHLGHIFEGEYLTTKNTRYCVNAASLDFVENNTVLDSEEAILAGGCFWGVDYYMKRIPGVLLVESGYTGGHVLQPSYTQICTGNTGHYEAVRIIFDPSLTSYEQILKRFFEIHDPTQTMGQGPDLGYQYQSVIFYYDEAQKNCAQYLIQSLEKIGYIITTTVLPVSVFWPAEAYHQNYYEKTGKQPYCHYPVKRFKD